MKLALFGSSGMLGQRILKEALNRDHQVTAIVREPGRVTLKHERLVLATGNVLDVGSVAQSTASRSTP